MAAEAIPETSKSCARCAASCGQEHRGSFGERPVDRQIRSKLGKILRWNQSQELAVDGEMSRSADLDRHLPEMRAALHMGKRLFHLVERKGLVDHGLHPVNRDGIRHRLEVLN